MLSSRFRALLSLLLFYNVAFANDWKTAAADAPVVLAAKVLRTENRLNKDSTYIYKVQTLQIVERLRGSALLRAGKSVELWYPLARVIRYADGSCAVPDAAHDAEGLAFANTDYSIYFCTKADTRRTRTIRLQPFAYSPEGISVFGYQKPHQPAAVAGFEGITYPTIRSFEKAMADFGLNIKTSPNIVREYAFPVAVLPNLKKNSSLAFANPKNGAEEKAPFEFSPKNIIAGSDEILTITAAKGNSFGKKRGEVFFTNAELGLCNERFYTNFCDSTDILEWSPSRIRIRVPSYIISSTFNEHAGTGPIIVKTHPTMNRYYYGTESLFIPYSFVNAPAEKKSTQKSRWFFANYRCQKGLNFAIDTSNIYKLTYKHKNPVAYRDSLVYAIGAAIRQWSRNLPGVTMTLAPNFVTTKTITDKQVRIISFSDDIQQPHREMFSYTKTESFAAARQQQVNQVSVRSVLEINVRSALTKEKMHYWVDTTMLLPKPINKRDFYVTIMHEIGHLLGLNHTLNDLPDEPRDLMSIYSCSARQEIFAYDRPSLQYQNCHAVQGAQQVLYASRRLTWSDKQEHVASLGSNVTPDHLTFVRQPRSNLFCHNRETEVLKYEVLPQNKNYSYEWQYSAGNKKGWLNIPTDDPNFTGQQTAVLRSKATIADYNGRMKQFRCMINSEGCSEPSEIVTYEVGLKKVIDIRPSGVSVTLNTPIELPKGNSQDGFFEGKGVTGGGGLWYFTPLTAGTGNAAITYKIRKPQSPPTSKNKYCTYEHQLKVISSSQARRTLATHPLDVPNRMTIRAEQPLSVALKLDGAGNYLPDNVFKIQLSDKEGNFELISPDDLSDLQYIVGEIKSPLASNATIQLPTTLPSGKHYRIRVIETSPFRIGLDNGFDITIRNLNAHEEEAVAKEVILERFKKL
jgi:hypothetical protein